MTRVQPVELSTRNSSTRFRICSGLWNVIRNINASTYIRFHSAAFYFLGSFFSFFLFSSFPFLDMYGMLDKNELDQRIVRFHDFLRMTKVNGNEERSRSFLDSIRVPRQSNSRF